MRTLRLRRVDALTANAKRKSCTTKLAQPQICRKIFQSLEVLVGGDLEFVPDGDDVRLKRDETLSLAAGAGRTDTSAPMTTTNSRSFTLWPREALHTSSTTCFPVCQRCDKRWALRSHPLPQHFIESHLFSFSHPGRPSPFSLTLRGAPDSLSLNLCVSQNDFQRGQELQFNLDVESRLQGLSGEVRVCTLATWRADNGGTFLLTSCCCTAPRFYPKKRCCWHHSSHDPEGGLWEQETPFKYLHLRCCARLLCRLSGCTR